MPPIPPENPNKKPLQSANRLPFEEYDHLSPAELHTLLTDTFEEYSPIRLHHERVDEAMAEAIPFLKLMLYFLSRVAEEKEFKLTAKGNLPRKLCLELYGLGIIKEEMIERGLTKLSKEEDSIVIQNLKYISLQSKLTKKRNGKFSLTKKGEKLLGSIPELFREVFITYGTKFNWGFHDGYPDEGQFQSTFGFCLYLLIRYGEQERSIRFYYEKLNTALPECVFPPGQMRRCMVIIAHITID
jgi:hypothetical protein